MTFLVHCRCDNRVGFGNTRGLVERRVICGGAAPLSGMKARLDRETNALDASGQGTRSVHVTVKPEYLAWKGASRVLDRYGDDVKWITKQQFEKEGQSISWSSFLITPWENDP
ncbi:hypothetical protein GF325_11455 [Candidatus Bathyarchaeota archaeon]|nr:hypothetical protein [Candidatus Bathyarchaeota archaeon]